MKHVSTLIDLLNMEQIDSNLFRGDSAAMGSPIVFGGQVLAQALTAARKTVPLEREVHSLHGYFILPGDMNKPIIFNVDTLRDGGSFTTRRVTASQAGAAIFVMAASFQIPQEGYGHQISMPNVTPPEALQNWEMLAKEHDKDLNPYFKQFFMFDRPIEFRPVEWINPAFPTKGRPYKYVWMRAKGEMPQESFWHRIVLAYASDYNLLSTALLPHGDEVNMLNMQMASLDHAMWFHRDFNMNDWLLYATDSPSASGARGFTRGNVFTRDGRLVASVTQEGLMRPRK